MLRPIKLFSRKNPACPDDFSLSVFAQGIASGKEKKDIAAHLSFCFSCREVLAAQERISLAQSKEGLWPAPEYLKGYAKSLLRGKKYDGADILIKFNEKMMKALQTPAEILSSIRMAGQVALRGKGLEVIEGQSERKVDPKKSSVQTLLLRRQMGTILFEIEIVRKKTVFQLTLQPKTIRGLQPINGLRVSLIRDSIEIESHFASQGQVCFDSLAEGAYSLEIRKSRSFLGRISLQFICV